MNQLSRESRALLAAARNAERTSEADRARIRGKLSRRLAVGLAMGTAVTASATAAEAAHTGVLATVAAWLPGAAKVIGLVAVTGAVSVGVVKVARTSADSVSAPAPVVSVSLQPRAARQTAGAARAAAPAAVDVPEITSKVSELQQESASVVQQTQATNMKPASRGAMPLAPAADTPVSADAPNLPGDNLGSQVSAIREARAAIRRGDPQAAIDAIDKQFPEGQPSPLEPEATLARISALCRLGNAVAARRVAEQFLAHFPESPLAARMRGSCAYVSVSEP